MTRPAPGTTAGFVLAGGRSSRMGRDKALLPFGGHTLLEEIAARVRKAAGSATIIGPVHRYQHLNLPILEDLDPGLGPLGGLATALESTAADWNLLVACDMPQVDVDLLRQLLEEAQAAGGRALIPRTERGWEPLCAVYHRQLRDDVQRLITLKQLKMQEFATHIQARPWLVTDPTVFENVNTPEDWGVRR